MASLIIKVMFLVILETAAPEVAVAVVEPVCPRYLVSRQRVVGVAVAITLFRVPGVARVSLLYAIALLSIH